MAAMNKEGVASALDALSPAEVKDSQLLLSSFRAFFARGSARDFFELLPSTDGLPSEQYSIDRFSQSCESSRNTPQTVCKQSRKSKSVSKEKPLGVVSDSSTESNNLIISMQEGRAFFEINVSVEAELSRLMRVLEGIVKSPRQPAEFYRGLWSAHKGRVFDTNGANQSRIARLFRGRKLIEQESYRFEYAGRLSLIFLAHDVEAIKCHNWKLAPGQSRQHAAVTSIAEHLNVDPEEIKKEWRRSRNYIRLLEECGPASLLELGTGVNWYWEKALSKRDVTLVIQFYKKRLPLFSTHTGKLNDVAGEIIIDGMLAYGWTLDAISKADTRLRNALAVHCPDVLSSVANGIASPNISVSENGNPNQSESLFEGGLGFRPTPSPSTFDFEVFRDFDIRSDCDLYLSHVSPDLSL